MALCNKTILLLYMISTILFTSTSSADQEAKDLGDIDKIIRDYALWSFSHHRTRTAVLYTVPMPPSLSSSVSALVVRYRTGSLWKHGAKIKEFLIQPGAVLHPHSKRIFVIHQNYGNLSSTYFFNHMNVHGYQLVSPVLGLLIYNASKLSKMITSNESLIEMMITEKPIRIDFSSVMESQGPQALCVFLGLDGKVSLLNKLSHNVCVAWRQGHFALVVPKSAGMKDGGIDGGVRLSRWRLVMVCSATAVFAAALMVLIIIAVVSVRKRRHRMTEMERRVYEDEALQVSMVDHVRAPTATVSRTTPVIETDYEPPVQ